MKKSRFSEEQIVGIFKQQAAGLPVAEICRKHGINDATFYAWRSRYGGMEVSDARRLKALDEETGGTGHLHDHAAANGQERPTAGFLCTIRLAT